MNTYMTVSFSSLHPNPTSQTSTHPPSSPTTVPTQGVLNSVAAGVLVYVALVEMAAEEFQSASITTEFALKAKMYMALSLGTFTMAIIAIWA